MPKVTINEVAQRAGVSPTAVSFAFNNPSRLSATTADRILAIARDLGYVPNPLSRGLVAGHVGVLGVIVPQSMNIIFANPPRPFATFAARG